MTAEIATEIEETAVTEATEATEATETDGARDHRITGRDVIMISKQTPTLQVETTEPGSAKTATGVEETTETGTETAVPDGEMMTDNRDETVTCLMTDEEVVEAVKTELVEKIATNSQSKPNKPREAVLHQRSENLRRI